MDDSDILSIVNKWKEFKNDVKEPEPITFDQKYGKETKIDQIPLTLETMELTKSPMEGNVSSQQMLALVAASKQISETEGKKLRPYREDSSCSTLLSKLNEIDLPEDILKGAEKIIENLSECVRKSVKKELLINRCIYDAACELGLVFDPALLSVLIYGNHEKSIREVYSLELPGSKMCTIYYPKSMFRLYLKLMTEESVRLRDVPKYFKHKINSDVDGPKAIGKTKYRKSEVPWTWGADVKHSIIKKHEIDKEGKRVYYITLIFTDFLEKLYLFDEMLRQIEGATEILDSRYPQTISAGTIYAFFEFHNLALDTGKMREVLRKSEASLTDVLNTLKKLVVKDQGRVFRGKNPCSL